MRSWCSVEAGSIAASGGCGVGGAGLGTSGAAGTVGAGFGLAARAGGDVLTGGGTRFTFGAGKGSGRTTGTGGGGGTGATGFFFAPKQPLRPAHSKTTASFATPDCVIPFMTACPFPPGAESPRRQCRGRAHSPLRFSLRAGGQRGTPWRDRYRYPVA